MRETIPFKVASRQKPKNFGINLIKKGKCLYNANFQTMKEELRKTLPNNEGGN